MEMVYVLIIIFSMGMFNKVMNIAQPIINEKEKVYYENNENIIKISNKLEEINITENTILDKEIKNIKIINPSKEEGDTKYPKKIKNDYIFPLIEYKEKYYNIIIEEDKIKINELIRIGEYTKTFKDYSDDKRKINTIYIEKGW